MTRKELLDDWKNTIALRDMYNDIFTQLIEQGYDIDVPLSMAYDEVSNSVVEVLFASMSDEELEHHIGILHLSEMLAQQALESVCKMCLVEKNPKQPTIQ